MPKTKIKKTQPAKREATPQPSAPVTIINGGAPLPPAVLLDIAEQEPDRRALAEYGRVIRVLRKEKRFTFREIAEWLNRHNVEADHNAVYREYTRGMPPTHAYEEGRTDADMERENTGN